MSAVVLIGMLCLAPGAGADGTIGGVAATTRILSLDDLIQRYATPASKFVDLDGIRVHYQDEGHGPAVLLVHGTLGDLRDWDPWAKTMKDRYRVIRLDLPGFGLSGEVPNGNYSIDRMLSLIDSLMDQLQQDNFAIVGISYGGPIAFRYAATRKSRVTALVLINSAGIESGRAIKDDKPGEAARKPRNDIFTGPVVTTEDIVRFYSAYVSDVKQLPEGFIQRKVDLLNMRGRDEIGRRIMALYERGNPQRVLAHVSAPSLVLWGTDNYALGNQVAKEFAAALTGACRVDVEFLESGGHYINVARPLETVKVTMGFLEKSREEPKCSAQRGCLGRGK
ncbi:MAG: alpha/beta hydrolase [Gammaproteobacteria bacterium PRO9]|nr:alpha/beta hydrolase [Gammaproteobacteria bacterium PRO9]